MKRIYAPTHWSVKIGVYFLIINLKLYKAADNSINTITTDMENLIQELGVLRNEVEKLRNTMDLNMNLLISRTDNVIKKVNEEPKKYKLVRFDIEKAKQGAKIVTKEGANARIICYDRKSEDFPIVAVVMGTDNDDVDEDIITYTKNGTYFNNGDESSYDLRIQED